MSDKREFKYLPADPTNFVCERCSEMSIMIIKDGLRLCADCCYGCFNTNSFRDSQGILKRVFKMVECIHCKEQMSRDVIDDHLEICPKRLIKCSDCDVKGTKEDIAEHLCKGKPELLIDKITDLKKKVDELKKRLNYLPIAQEINVNKRGSDYRCATLVGKRHFDSRKIIIVAVFLYQDTWLPINEDLIEAYYDHSSSERWANFLLSDDLLDGCYRIYFAPEIV